MNNYFNKNTDLSQIPNNVKCYNKCVIEKECCILKNETFDINLLTMYFDNLMDLEDHTDSYKALEKCVKLRGSSDCETSFVIVRCINNDIYQHILDK